ncbi:MAG TPA: SIMPL domain-containing protein [Caulobacteraceae bacterium]
MTSRALPVLWGAAALALAGAAGAQSAPDADAMFHATTLSISASGEVKALPDKAAVGLGVQTTAATAAQAMADNAGRMTQVIAALRRQGLEGKDVQTSGVNLAAQYDYQPNKPPRLIGYQASNQVTVSVHDVARIGPALDAATAAGADSVNGVSFGLEHPEALEDQARLKAVQALQARAQLYAGAAGYRVGRLVSLSEGGGVQPLPYAPKMMTMAAARAAPTPIEPGELTVRIEVSGLYELAR